MKDIFNAASGAEPIRDEQQLPQTSEAIVTRRELDALEALRASPRPRLALEPHSREAHAIDRLIDQRVHHLRQRLDISHDGFERDFDNVSGGAIEQDIGL